VLIVLAAVTRGLKPHRYRIVTAIFH